MEATRALEVEEVRGGGLAAQVILLRGERAALRDAGHNDEHACMEAIVKDLSKRASKQDRNLPPEACTTPVGLKAAL